MVLIVIGLLFLGILAGILVERMRWNALIDKGVLPRPATSNRDRGR